MARPHKYGPRKVSDDLVCLTRILSRIETDPHLPEADRERCARAMKNAIVVLSSAERGRGDEAPKIGKRDQDNGW